MALARLPVLALTAASLCVLGQLAPAAAQPGPKTSTQIAVNRVLTDTRGLSASDASAGTRTALVAAARRVSELAPRRPCGAIRQVRRYRGLLDGVSDRTPEPPGAVPGPASPRGTLDRDALAIEAGLKQLPQTSRCGGGATGAGPTLDSDVAESSKATLKLHVTLPVTQWEARGGGGSDFIGLNQDGADFLGDVGDPGVPAFTRLFAVPRGASVSAKVSNVRGYTLEGIDIFPKQEQAGDQAPPPDERLAEAFADKPFAMDTGAYRSGGLVPRRLAHVRTLGQIRDLRVGAVQVPGAQYDPARRRARIFTSMTITVTFRGGGTWRPQRVRTALENPFERIYRAALENHATVPRPNRATAAQVPTCGEEYLIVTTPALRPAANELGWLKKGAGVKVAIQEFAQGTAAADIRTFIRGELNDANCVRPTYVVLFGDTSHVPTFSEPCTSSVAQCPVASDLSYSLNGVGTDLFADVMLGRISANTLDQAYTTVQKIVRYQTELPAPAGDDFYNHATVTSYFQGPGPVDERGYTMSSERFRAGLRSRGHVAHRLYYAAPTADVQFFRDNSPIPDELKRPGFPWDADSSDFLAELNAGRFLVLHRDHGWKYGWAEPTLHTGHVPLMTNGTELPVVFGVNCLSGSFQDPGDPSMNERLLHHPNGGAVAAFGDTNISPTVQNDHLTVGFADAMFPATVPGNGQSTPLERLGEMFLSAKAYMASQSPATSNNVYVEHLMWHLLGDPSMEIRNAEPARFDLAQNKTRFLHRTDSYPVGDPSFRVRVTSTQPGTDGTLATLMQGSQVIGRATVEGGIALITPTKRTDSSNLSVALERDGFIAEQLPVPAPVPNLTMNCPPDVNVDNVMVSGAVSPAVSGARVSFRATWPSGLVTTHSTLTKADSTYAFKIPLPPGETGMAKIEAFYDGELKYGADHLECMVEL